MVKRELRAAYDGHIYDSELIYSEDEPLLVQFVILEDEWEYAWELSLELLRQGVDSRRWVGPGFVKIRRNGRNVMIKFEHEDSDATAVLPTKDLREFLSSFTPAELVIDDDELSDWLEGC